MDADGKLVDQAGQTMALIVGSVKQVSDIMGAITTASEEQSDGIAQVTQAITQMDPMTQQNAALVQQAAASASMQGHARRLGEAIGADLAPSNRSAAERA